MINEKMKIINDSYRSFKLEAYQASINNDVEEVQYYLFRAFRLLSRLDSIIEKAIEKMQKNSLIKAFEMKREIDADIGDWLSKLSFQHTKNGFLVDAEKIRLFSLAFDKNSPNNLLQYAHNVLNSKQLYVNREIDENMKNVNPENVREITLALKRAKSVVMAVSSRHREAEQRKYLLEWITQMQRNIEERADLNDALAVNEKQSTVSTLEELEQLIGLPTVKTKVQEICDWVIFNQMRQEQGYKTDKISLHMVFSGNSGTGKTTMARLIANLFKSIGVLTKGHLVEVSRSDLVAEYVGQTAVKTMKKIREAKGGILFIDEAHALSRTIVNDFGIEAIDTLVKEMEDERRNLVVIFAGYPAEMDTFMKSNPGLRSRVNYHINFPDYTVEELIMISELIMKQKDYRMTADAVVILKNMIQESIELHPATHGNGRLVRNLIEKAILTKANYAVDQKRREQALTDLDLLDFSIMKSLRSKTHSQKLKSNAPQHKNRNK